MTPKQRFLAALRRQVPDCVPASPDMSNMIPAKLTGKPFWDVYLHRDPPLHIAYLEVLKKYRHEGGWEVDPGLDCSYQHDRREFKQAIVSKTDDRLVVRKTCRTPDGDLWQETTYYRDNPPTLTRKWVKDFDKDLPLYLKHFLEPPDRCDDTVFQAWKQAIGDRGISTVWLRYPGFQDLVCAFDGGLEQVAYTWFDHPGRWDEYRERYHQYMLALLDFTLAAQPDFVTLTASGTLTLASPDIFRRLGLPTVRELTRRCRAAGVPTLLHSCGKERALVRMCAEETDLDGINPLEIPPMGDCDLGELKRAHGRRLCLMGNLHTTNVMLLGTPDDVERATRRAIDDAAAGGGFILSTGDQCPRDTPEENLHRLVEVAHAHGRYVG